MSIIDDLLERYNVKYEDLNAEERAQLTTWLNALQQNELTLEKARDYIRAMRDAVETQLIDEPEFTYIFIFKVPNRNQILLKARLKNYMMIEALLSSPEKAKEQIERAIAGMARPSNT